MSVVFTPTRATTIFHLPEHCACAYSPGFDLHISGIGDTEDDARGELVARIRDLAAQLMVRADEVRDAA